MGGSSVPQTSPADSARAEALAQLAGSEFNLGTAPLQAYAEAINALQFNPTFQRISNADAANSALANAQASKQVNAQVNPYAAAGQDMMSRQANQRLASVMGGTLTPGLTPSNTTQAFQYPSSSSLPNFQDIMGQAKSISSAFPKINIGNNDVSLTYPSTKYNPMPPLFNPVSYYNIGGTGA